MDIVTVFIRSLYSHTEKILMLRGIKNNFRSLWRVFFAFNCSVIVCAIISSVLSSQWVLFGLSELNIKIPIQTWIKATIFDLFSLATLIPVFAIALFCGFAVCRVLILWLYQHINPYRLTLYCIAGAVAILSVLVIIETILNLMPLAGARTTIGLFTQALAGMVGGAIYAKMTQNSVL